MNPDIYITKFGSKYSVRIEWRKEAYRLVESFDDLVELLEKEFGEKGGQGKE